MDSHASVGDDQTMGAQRENFFLVGQASGGQLPLDDVELVLDNNVVGIADSVARKGYTDANVQHRRVKALYRWIEGRRNVQINHYLGSVEGANFDGFTVSPYNLHKRLTSAGALFELARAGASIDPFDGEPVLQAIRIADPSPLDDAVDSARRHFGVVVLPNYVAILHWHLLRKERSDLDAAGRLRELHRRVVASMNFVPLACPMLLYAELGAKDVANTVGKGLLKVHHRDLATSARSGAWDVGFLSYLSHLRLWGQLAVDGTSVPVLVTDDDKFADSARLLPAIGNTGLIRLDPGHFRNPELAANLTEEFLESRASATPRFPKWESLISIARGLESELGVEEAHQLRVDAPVARLAPDGMRMTAVLDLLNLPLDDLLARIEDEPPQLYASLFVARFVLASSDEDDDVILVEALRRVAPAAIDNVNDRAANSFLAALGLIHAWGAGDDSRTTAYLEAVEINHYPRLVKLIVVRLCTELVAISAERHGLTTDEEIARLRDAFSTFPAIDEAPRSKRSVDDANAPTPG